MAQAIFITQFALHIHNCTRTKVLSSQLYNHKNLADSQARLLEINSVEEEVWISNLSFQPEELRYSTWPRPIVTTTMPQLPSLKLTCSNFRAVLLSGAPRSSMLCDPPPWSFLLITVSIIALRTLYRTITKGSSIETALPSCI
jgi:hypothetical protein